MVRAAFLPHVTGVDAAADHLRPLGGIERDVVVRVAPFQGAHVTAESAPIARQALVEDRVIEMDAETVAREVPERFRTLLDDAVLVCVPLSAGGRWSGVILADRRPRLRYRVGREATWVPRVRMVAPPARFEATMRRMFGLDAAAGPSDGPEGAT